MGTTGAGLDQLDSAAANGQSKRPIQLSACPAFLGPAWCLQGPYEQQMQQTNTRRAATGRLRVKHLVAHVGAGAGLDARLATNHLDNRRGLFAKTVKKWGLGGTK